MKNMKNKLAVCFCVYLYLWNGQFTAAQSVEQGRLKIDKEEKQITIPYSLKDGNRRAFKYNVDISYTQDGGKTFVGPLQKVTGDIGKDLLAGEDRTIVWDYLAENPSFNGRNVQFRIEVEAERLMGGPRNALLSALVPGLGNTQVRNRGALAWRWVFTSLATYGLIGSSFYFKNQSDQNYAVYQNSYTVEQVQDAYKLANRQSNLAKLSAIAAGLVWATDIVRVAIKGGKNIAEQRRLLQLPQNQRRENNNTIGLRFQLENATPQLGLVWKLNK